MDDLLGEDWQKPARPPTANTPSSASAFAANYHGFRASPQLQQGSGAASPHNISRPASTVNGAKASSNDSFGGLLALKSQKAGSGLSMQERQKQLLEEKRRQQEQQSHLWDTLGSGSGTPEIRQPSPALQESEDDILAAFNKDAPVNKASWFSPPPSSGPVSGRSTPGLFKAPTPVDVRNGDLNDDDDDPFGLRSMPAQSNGHAKVSQQQPSGDGDDILGDLGRPVSELPSRTAPMSSTPVPQSDEAAFPRSRTEVNDPQDRALAELVDMGFPTDRARRALAETGGDVQEAVGWLLEQAHEESRRNVKGAPQSQSTPRSGSQSPHKADRQAMPTWMREEARPASGSRQRDDASPVNADKAAQVAQELGSKLFKSANSIWKASQKQMAKKMSEFQSDGDPSQPKWMRDTSSETSRVGDDRRARQTPTDWTDEAAMLDAPRERPQKPARPSAPSEAATLPSRPREPVEPPSRQPQPIRPLQQYGEDRRPSARLSRQEVEQQSSQAYVSPARRKRQTPVPVPQSEPQIEVDLFSSAPPRTTVPNPAPSAPARSSQPASTPRAAPAPPRPQAPSRAIPPVSAAALTTSAAHRKAGGEHFKRGDYSAAHDSYTAALSPLPATHPIAIIVLSNRALTAIKTGDAKVAVADADRALDLIGPSLGAGETIDLGGAEGTKDMKDFYGKSIMRKAEALEHLERYTDAAAAWRAAVAVGAGGAISLRGRDRCEKAAAPTSAALAAVRAKTPVRSSAPARVAPPARALGNSLKRPTLTTAQSAEAVRKLRAANAAAEKADDEKFALTDQVDARLAAWRGGKTDNLRALLQSMDAVLWPEAGWKKVGMADLVIAGKVKIIYMKAIAKVHPDKIPQDATTEQRMISSAVFSTLNEAWDKFKRDNNL